MANKNRMVFAALCVAVLSFVLSGCVDDPLDDYANKDLIKSAIATRGGEGGSPYYFYDHEGEKVYLSLNTEYAFLSAKESKSMTDITRRDIKSTEFQPDKTSTSRYSSELRFEKALSDEQYLKFLSNLRKQNDGIIVSPYFNDQYGNKIGLSNFFYVKLKDEGDVALLENTAGQFDCTIVGRDEFMPLWFTLSVTETSNYTALEYANIFHESGLFAAGEPDLMADVYLSANDRYYGNQWELKNTGQYGGVPRIDINIESAWQVSTGSGITVAVLDTGIDLGHPDLANNIHSLSYDCESVTTPQRIRTIGDPNHGTAVAGIVGAVRNNSAGITGVAPNCKLMAVSHSLTNNTNVRQQLAAGINWAWQNGADVINCSWGHQTALSGSYITDAVNNAVTQGRGGKGCVVVFASGNDNRSSVSYPASLSNVIAVGAISIDGKRKSPSSPDGENWGSNYGSALDVIAPGVLIPTTDRQGYAGYNPNYPIHTNNGGNKVSTDYSDQNYTVWFNGTSAACPQVSGIAALILSKYPNFTAQHVRNIIESTADRYPSRSNEYGYGLVNAHKALFGHLVPTGMPLPGFRVRYTYSVPAAPTGVTFNGWSVSGPGAYIIDGGTTGGTLNITFNGFGEYTLSANYTLPDNSPYSGELTVTVPHSLPTPQISGSGGYGGGSYFAVDGPISGAYYQWTINGQSIGTGESSVTIPSHMSGNVRCRAYYMGVYSDWSREIYAWSYSPAPKPSAEEDEL